MFEWLAHEETGRIKMLEAAIAELKENNLWPTQDMWGTPHHVSEPVDVSEFPSKPEVMGSLPPDAPELAILKKAIEAEQDDAAYHDKVAQAVDEPNGRIMLEKLAHVEKGHVRLLKEEYDWIKHSKDLFTLHRFQPGK